MADNLFERDYDYDRLFLFLPDLVVEKLINFLDEESKLTLRLVCKTTQFWVSSWRFLKRFQIPLNSDPDLEHYINCWEEWSNFDLKNEINTYDPPTISKFFSNYTGHLRSLTFKELKWCPSNLPIILECSNLESLTVSTLKFDSNIDVNIDNLFFDNLHRLCIQTLHFSEETQLTSYSKFLKSCQNLIHMLIPRPQGPPEVTWVRLKQIQLDLIIQPVMSYLLARPSSANLKILDVDNVFSRHFGPLSETCVSTGTLLLNVNDKQVKYVFLNSEDFLRNIISIRENIDDRRPLAKWCNLERMFVRTSRCDVRRHYDDNRGNVPGLGDAVTLPKLKSIHMVFDSMSRTDLGFSRLFKIVRLLIRTYRPGVEELILKWPEFCHDTPLDVIDVYDVIRNFPGLKRLKFIGWGKRIGEEGQGSILRQNLTHLKYLTFE